MSSSSPRRSRALLAAGALTALAGALAWAGAAGAASQLDIVAVVPGDAQVTMVVGVDPPPSLAEPGAFEVASGDSGKLPTDARPVLGPQLATATVLDTSADGARALQNGINGTTNLLLQLPDGVRNLVVADGGTAPQTLAPLTQGATEAVAALNSARAGGTRHPAAALDAAVAGMPAESGRSRLVVLYTSAPDAGGEPADQLGRRLAQAGAVLAVVNAGPGQRYWSDAAAITGGVVVPAAGSASLRPFDQLVSLLRGRFVLTFPRPAVLPTTVRVSMTVAGETVTQSAMVPEVVAETEPESSEGSGTSAWWWVLGALVLVGLVAVGLVLWRRRGAGPKPGAAVEPRRAAESRPLPTDASRPTDASWPLPTGVSRPTDASWPLATGTSLPPPTDGSWPPPADGSWPLPRRQPSAGGSAIAARAGSLPDADPSSDHGTSGADKGTSRAGEGTSRADQGALGAGQNISRIGQATPRTGTSGADQGTSRAGEGTSLGADQGTSRVDQGASGAGQGGLGADRGAGAGQGIPRGGEGAGGSSVGGSGAEREDALTAADRAAIEAAERAGVGRMVGDPAGANPAGANPAGANPAGANPAGSSTLPPRRRPGAGRRNGGGVDDPTVEIARPRGIPPAPQHPAADERAYTRLGDETDRVAAAVAGGTMEFRHAVAQIALAAPGRVDLLDRVIETERRLQGVQMGAAAPSEVTLKLLTTARRVVAGEVALVGPRGVRVEQASSVLRLIHPDRTTHEYRSANELARHLDLNSLSVDG